MNLKKLIIPAVTHAATALTAVAATTVFFLAQKPNEPPESPTQGIDTELLATALLLAEPTKRPLILGDVYKDPDPLSPRWAYSNIGQNTDSPPITPIYSSDSPEQPHNIEALCRALEM